MPETVGCQYKPRSGLSEISHCEKDTYSSEDHCRRWIYLYNHEYQTLNELTLNFLKLPRLIPPPIAPESAWRTFTVGLSHLVNLSSVLRDWPNPGICSLSTERTASGESQVSSLESSGWERRSFFVFFLYASKALSKMD